MGGPGSGNKAYGLGKAHGRAEGLAEGLAKGRAQGAVAGLGRAALLTGVVVTVIEVGRAFGPDLVETVKQRWARRGQRRLVPGVRDETPADEAEETYPGVVADELERPIAD